MQERLCESCSVCITQRLLRFPVDLKVEQLDRVIVESYSRSVNQFECVEEDLGLVDPLVGIYFGCIAHREDVLRQSYRRLVPILQILSWVEKSRNLCCQHPCLVRHPSIYPNLRGINPEDEIKGRVSHTLSSYINLGSVWTQQMFGQGQFFDHAFFQAGRCIFDLVNDILTTNSFIINWLLCFTIFISTCLHVSERPVLLIVPIVRTCLRIHPKDCKGRHEVD